MIIKDFYKFEVDYKRNEMSLYLFDNIYSNYLDKILLIKAKNLIDIFNNDIDNTKIVSSYTAYVDYVFPSILEKTNLILDVYNQMVSKKTRVPNNIVTDIQNIESLRDEVQSILSSHDLIEINNKKDKILSGYYLAVLENINGLKSQLCNKKARSLLKKEDLNIVHEVNEKVNDVSIDASYESHKFLFKECIDILEIEIYREILDKFDVIMNQISMLISKIKFDVNTYKMMGVSERPEDFYYMMYYIEDIEYFLQTLVIFHDFNIDKPEVMPFEQFIEVYNEGTKCKYKPFLSEKLRVIGNDCRFFYNTYNHIAKLSSESKQIVYVTNKILNEFNRFLDQNEFDSCEVKKALKETVQMKIINIQENFVMCDDIENKLKLFIKDVLIGEISLLEEVYKLSLSKLDEFDEECFILAFEDMFYKIMKSLKDCDVEVFEPIAGEKFEGKIHIVENVENSENYKKGSIVRVLLNGFEYKEEVILKAKVVCAS